MGDSEIRTALIEIFHVAVAAVDPRVAVSQALTVRDGRLRCGPVDFDLSGRGRLLVVAFGKAAPAMCAGLADVVAGHRLEGIVVTNHDEPAPLPVVVGGHPLPDLGSVAGAEAALEIAAGAGPDDLILCLISGGGSAIVESPAPGIDLADLIATSRALLTSGANIVEFNTVRKHLSRVKGGRLAEAAGTATLLTLVLSDVVGDPLDVIASGPTVPDPTTYQDAARIVRNRGLVEALPPAVVAHLDAGTAGTISETPSVPHPRSHIAVIGNGPRAAAAAAAAAAERGIAAEVVATDLTGEARVVAAELLARRRGELEIYAGETTVSVGGGGSGGRNQEAALAAAIAIAGHKDVTFLAAGTDGIDGPTPAAGAVVDGTTVPRGATMGFDAAAYLADNDAYTFLEATGDVLVTGPTGTNVGDLWLLHRNEY
jgi:hydroxypyruvate reductase